MTHGAAVEVLASEEIPATDATDMVPLRATVSDSATTVLSVVVHVVEFTKLREKYELVRALPRRHAGILLTHGVAIEVIASEEVTEPDATDTVPLRAAVTDSATGMVLTVVVHDVTELVELGKEETKGVMESAMARPASAVAVGLSWLETAF